jgi:hypothetical protein
METLLRWIMWVPQKNFYEYYSTFFFWQLNIIQHKTREFVWILFNIRKCVEEKKNVRKFVVSNICQNDIEKMKIWLHLI